jgi:hypothetical protein
LTHNKLSRLSLTIIFSQTWYLKVRVGANLRLG